MTWVAGNMLPVVAMYNKGEINAIFFATTAVQQSLLSPNGLVFSSIYNRVLISLSLSLSLSLFSLSLSCFSDGTQYLC